MKTHPPLASYDTASLECSDLTRSGFVLSCVGAVPEAYAARTPSRTGR
jgi:hypothetical protein